MLPLRKVTHNPKPTSPPPTRAFSPTFTKHNSDPVIREQNRRKATEATKQTNKALTWRQKKFVAEYLADPNRNASAAAKRAGYSLDFDPSWLFRHPQIKSIIDIETRKVLSKLEITKEKVLQEVATLAFSNLDQFLTPDPDNPNQFLVDLNKASVQQMAAVKDYYVEKDKVRIALHDKLSSLTLLGKYLKLFEETTNNKHTFSFSFFDDLIEGKASFSDLSSTKVIEAEAKC